MNKNEELLPYYEKARETLDYNSSTGELTWAIKRSNRVKRGDVAGYIDHYGYRILSATIDGVEKALKAHRLVWFIENGYLPSLSIDHIDMNKSNNNISNLREATSKQQNQNKKKYSNNTSGYKGVSKSGKKWIAKTRYNSAELYLGTFNTLEEASEAYQAKAKELHGEFYAEEA